MNYKLGWNIKLLLKIILLFLYSKSFITTSEYSNIIPQRTCSFSMVSLQIYLEKYYLNKIVV